MKSAVIATGGKQYFVQEGDVIDVEKLLAESGDTITFDEVLMVATDQGLSVGAPLLIASKVEGKVVKHARHKKVFGVHMKAKKRLKKYFGHRQHFTQVEITKVSTT